MPFIKILISILLQRIENLKFLLRATWNGLTLTQNMITKLINMKYELIAIKFAYKRHIKKKISCCSCSLFGVCIHGPWLTTDRFFIKLAISRPMKNNLQKNIAHNTSFQWTNKILYIFFHHWSIWYVCLLVCAVCLYSSPSE